MRMLQGIGFAVGASALCATASAQQLNWVTNDWFENGTITNRVIAGPAAAPTVNTNVFFGNFGSVDETSGAFVDIGPPVISARVERYVDEGPITPVVASAEAVFRLTGRLRLNLRWEIDEFLDSEDFDSRSWIYLYDLTDVDEDTAPTELFSLESYLNDDLVREGLFTMELEADRDYFISMRHMLPSDVGTDRRSGVSFSQIPTPGAASLFGVGALTLAGRRRR